MEKTFREIKSYDTIEVTSDIVTEARKMYQEVREKMEGTHSGFILNEGVIKCSSGKVGVTQYTYFNLDYETEKLIIDIYLHQAKDYTFTRIIGAQIKFEGQETVPEITYALAPGRDDLNKIMVADFLDTWSYVTYLANCKETKIVERSTKARANGLNSSGGISGKNKSQKRRVIDITADRVKYVMTAGDDTASNIIKRSYMRHAGSWSVKGFFRTYKSGKTVWVSPHVRGEGPKSKKTYIVGGRGDA